MVRVVCGVRRVMYVCVCVRACWCERRADVSVRSMVSKCSLCVYMSTRVRRSSVCVCLRVRTTSAG
jgi:hypothetical protein